MISKAKIDSLYTIGSFTNHIEVIENINIWKNHSQSFDTLENEILNELSEDDILFIKTNKDLEKFIHKVQL